MRLEHKIDNYKYLHQVIRKCFDIIPNKCERCNKKSNLDMANISGKYHFDLSDWEFLCRKCHMHSDGRINNLSKGRWSEKTYCECGNQAVTRNGVCMKKYNCLRRHKQPCLKACQ